MSGDVGIAATTEMSAREAVRPIGRGATPCSQGGPVAHRAARLWATRAARRSVIRVSKR
jgi:hypothetical protein